MNRKNQNGNENNEKTNQLDPHFRDSAIENKKPSRSLSKEQQEAIEAFGNQMDQYESNQDC